MLFLAWCCLCCYPGCLAIPIPQSYRHVETAGKKVEAKHLDFVVPGQTTKAEFIDRVGRPYLVMEDWGLMAYYWKMLAAYWLYAAPMAGGIARTDYQYLLLVSYDDQGVIKNFDTIQVELKALDAFLGPKTINEHALGWAGQGAMLGGKFTPVDLPAGKAVVNIFHAFDLAGRHDYPLDGIFLDGVLCGELAWGQYAALIVSPGAHTIGFESRIRNKEEFLHPHRPAPAPSTTTTIDARPNQSYYLGIFYVSGNLEKKAIFSEFSADVARPKIAGFTRAR